LGEGVLTFATFGFTVAPCAGFAGGFTGGFTGCAATRLAAARAGVATGRCTSPGMLLCVQVEKWHWKNKMTMKNKLRWYPQQP
jgi:hypothetical protein